MNFIACMIDVPDVIEMPLDELYFRWLYDQVANARLKNPAHTYWSLLRQLYTTEFVWYVPNDDNRVEEGKELRYEFLGASPDTMPDRIWLEEGSSFLEMLIALSRRLSFEEGRASSREWFWQMIDNIDLRRCDLEYQNYPIDVYAKSVLQMLNDRTYDCNGKGGLFPLNNIDIDQRDVELWYQMTYYLIERG